MPDNAAKHTTYSDASHIHERKAMSMSVKLLGLLRTLDFVLLVCFTGISGITFNVGSFKVLSYHD
jgi:hypothetical protein